MSPWTAAWVLVSYEFQSEDDATLAVNALGDHLGGLQCRSAAGKGEGVRRTEAGWVGAIETSPETASFAFGFLAG